MSECLVCFSEIELTDPVFSCGYPQCESKICSECISRLMEISSRRTDSDLPSIPICPNKNCKKPILYSSSWTAEVKQHYGLAILRALTLQNGDSVSKVIQQKRILENIRAERIKFVYENFPLGVALTISVALRDKLKKIEKNRSKKISETLQKSHKKCINLTCNGNLDESLKCLVCSTIFCETCEKRKNPGHICKQEDIDSVNFLSGMIKCPECSSFVEKSEGCDEMTCALCQTNFDYSTGKVSHYGNNHNKPVPKIEYNVIHVYSDRYPALKDLLIKLDSLKPKEISQAKINTVIRKLLEGTFSEEDLAIEMGKEFTKYMLAKSKHFTYQQALATLENSTNFEKDLQILLNQLN